jgi:hypothetical protein
VALALSSTSTQYGQEAFRTAMHQFFSGLVSNLAPENKINEVLYSVNAVATKDTQDLCLYE